MNQPSKISLPPITDILQQANYGVPSPPQFQQPTPPSYYPQQPPLLLFQRGAVLPMMTNSPTVVTPPPGQYFLLLAAPNYRYDYYKPSVTTPPPATQAVMPPTAGSGTLTPQLMHPTPTPPTQYRELDVQKMKRKTCNNLPKETTYLLLKWLNDHLNHPYPNSFEKNQLMLLTGLNQQQLSNWFINARRRKIKTMKEQKRLNLV